MIWLEHKTGFRSLLFRSMPDRGTGLRFVSACGLACRVCYAEFPLISEVVRFV